MKLVLISIVLLFAGSLWATELEIGSYEAEKVVRGREELVGVVEVLPNHKVAFHFNDNITLYGSFHETNSVMNADLVDRDNATMWMQTARLQIDLSHVDLDEVNDGAKVRVKVTIWLDGGRNPYKSLDVNFQRQ